MTDEEWARKQAEEYIAAQVAAVEEQRRLYMEELQRQAALQAERGRALGQYLQQQNFPGMIQDIYSNAAKDIAGFAGGFAGDVRNIANAQAAEQLNMVSGTGQEGAVRNEGEGMGNVLYGVGGQIPGTALSQAGAAFGSLAALEPSFAARQGALDASTLFNQGLGNMSDFAKQIAEIKAQSPELQAKFLEQKQSLKAQAAKTKQDALDAERDWAMKTAEFNLKKLESERDWLIAQAKQALAEGKEDRYNQLMTLAFKKEANRQMQLKGMDADGNPLPGYHRDKSTGQIIENGWKIGKNGEPVKIGGSKATLKQSELKTVASMSRDGVRKASLLFYDKNGRLKPNYQNKGGKEIYAILWANMGGNSLQTGAARIALRKTILQIMKALGMTNIRLRRSGAGVSDTYDRLPPSINPNDVAGAAGGETEDPSGGLSGTGT